MVMKKRRRRGAKGPWWVEYGASFCPVILVVCRLRYVVTTLFYWLRWSWPPALAATGLTRLCGIAALLWLDRVQALARRAGTYLRFVRQPELQRALADEGQEILETLRAFEARLSR